uniref:Uncharacterized protein n=1 Tax=Glossina austeni TaxID=7395 RepID=A0A1A9VW56_GLOAU
MEWKNCIIEEIGAPTFSSKKKNLPLGFQHIKPSPPVPSAHHSTPEPTSEAIFKIKLHTSALEVPLNFRILCKTLLLLKIVMKSNSNIRENNTLRLIYNNIMK